jgi:molecular chaperone GrpE (heat shock protein)
MSKHFEDARYYLGRAAEHAKAGVKEELEPVEARVKALRGGTEEEPEPSRLDRIQADLKQLEERAEGEAREAIASARARLKEYRGHDAAAE